MTIKEPWAYDIINSDEITQTNSEGQSIFSPNCEEHNFYFWYSISVVIYT